MVRDNALKKSFLISFIAHIIFLIPWQGLIFRDAREEKRTSLPVIVAYDIGPQENLEEAYENKLEQETDFISEVESETEISEPASPDKEKQLFAEALEDAPPYEDEKYEVGDEEVVSLSEEVVGETVPPAVIDYYRAIREEIKKMAYHYRPDFRGAGSVIVYFTVSSDGVLQGLAIDNAVSTDVNRLRETALRSVRQAAPFSSFPEELKNDLITFSIAIEFELR